MYVYMYTHIYISFTGSYLIVIGMDDYDQSSNESSGNGEIIKPLM